MTTHLGAGSKLDQLTITIIVDNATDTLASIGSDLGGANSRPWSIC
jgi:hypothetical protein